MTYTLFLDDERFPADETNVIARSFNDATEYVIEHGTPTHVCFDHDLGHGKTGYDFAHWLIDRDLDGFGFTESFSVHSHNPIGAANIRMAMESYMRQQMTQKSNG